MHVKAA